MGNKRIYSAEVVLGFIMILAAILRFYRFGSIPFTNDELSALMRTRFDSLTELFQSGIYPDGHPALIQLVLYGLTGISSTSQWVIKLPFALTGLASVWVAYQLTSKIFSKNTGLAVAAFMATSQYFVMHSQLARPYTPGLLFVLLFALQCVRVVLYENRNRSSYIFLGIWAFLAASTHYFSLFAVVLLAVVFVGVEQKIFRRRIIISLLVSVLIYLPQLPILIQHIQTGGIGGEKGWLGIPDTGFLVHFFTYLFQFHTLSVMWYVLLLLITMFMLLKASAREFIILSLLTGLNLITWITAWIYSVYRNPLLQYSTLFFVTPFLLMVVFYGLHKIRPRYALFAILSVMVINTYVLIYKRQHYQLFYHQGYQAVSEFYDHNPVKSVLLSGNHRSYFDFYLNRHKSIPGYFFVPIGTFDPSSVHKYLSAVKSDTLLLAFGAPGNIGLLNEALRFFPYLLKHEAGAAFDCYLLTVHENPERELLYDTKSDTSQFFNLDQQTEFSESIILDKKNFMPWSWVQVSVNLKDTLSVKSHPSLVLQAEDKYHKVLGWYGIDLTIAKSFNPSPLKFTLPVRLSDISGDVSFLKTYLWNQHAGLIQYSKPRFKIYKGNPYLYGLVEQVPEKLKK